MTPLAPKVRAVVLNYNGGDFVLQCLRALLATDWPEGRLEVVVVDNASADGSDRRIEELFPSVRLIRSPSNDGFPANNLALRDLGDCDYAALVNNDAFVEPDWLGPLVAVLEADDRLGAACPKIVFAPSFVDLELETDAFVPPGDGRELGVRVSGVEVDGVAVWRDAQFTTGFWDIEHGPAPEETFRWTGPRAVLRVPIASSSPPTTHGVSVRIAGERAKPVRFSSGESTWTAEAATTPASVDGTVAGPGYDVINNVGSKIVPLGYGADRGFLERDEGQYDAAAEVFAWCGGGVLLRAAYLQDVGLFDERFFMYYEDTDLAWRGRSRGWRYRYVPESRMRHVHAATAVEGSPMFQHFVERNRLVMLTKNAPIGLLATAIARYITATGSYALRDIVKPAVRAHRPQHRHVVRRVKSFLAWLALLPAMLGERRRISRRRTVGHGELDGWMAAS